VSDLQLEQLTAIVDTREQMAWNLEPMKIVAKGLDVGDYSILGLESVIAIERKSLADFVMCCGGERERFQRELDRLRGWPVHAVIIEASWGEFQMAQWRSKLTSKQVMASFVSWVAQGHTLILAGNAENAALVCRGILFYAARYRMREAESLLKNVGEKGAA
jgi:ERCC4-type nuclease